MEAPGGAGLGGKFFRGLLDSLPDGIVVLGEGGVIRYANPSAVALLGPGAAAGGQLADLVADDARAGVRRAVGQMLRGSWQPGGDGGATWRVPGPGGGVAHVEVRCRELGGPPAGSGVMLALRDVTAQRAREDELRHRASHDALTGLPNRALFAGRVSHALAVARRVPVTAAVLYVDLDDFKAVNDTLGHGAGDELLRAVAGRLRLAAARETDTPARLGGDEFAVLLEGLSGPAEAEAFAGRVVKALGEPFPLAAGLVSAGASVGIATTADTLDPEEILAFADRALYAAKHAGRGGWARFDALAPAAPRGRGRHPVPGPARAARGAAGTGPPATLATVRLLRALLAAPEPLPTLELARRTGVDKATAYRTLAGLAATGWLATAQGSAAGPAGGRPARRYALTGPGRARAAGTLTEALGPQESPVPEP